MRIGLIAMQRTGNGEVLRGEMMLVGRSVIAWQAALLRSLGAERIICLADTPSRPELIALQQTFEGEGLQFHQLPRFAALPALVRADDDLIVLLDGLLPDLSAVRAVLQMGESPLRAVATLPADHPLSRNFPQDFERIDAARHWGGILAMRGASVQKLADFPDDSDAVSLLLRLALQSGTPGHDVSVHALAAKDWLLAHDASALALHEHALMASAVPKRNWRAPGSTLAAMMASAAALRGIDRAGIAADALAVMLLSIGIVMTAAGHPSAGLGAAGLGVLAAQTAAAFRLTRERLYVGAGRAGGAKAAAIATDCLAAITLWFALAPLGVWQPLAIMGPLVIGLVRVFGAGATGAALHVARDRASLLLALALAAGLGWLPELLACLALGLVAALLLRVREE